MARAARRSASRADLPAPLVRQVDADGAREAVLGGELRGAVAHEEQAGRGGRHVRSISEDILVLLARAGVGVERVDVEPTSDAIDQRGTTCAGGG